MDNSLPQIGLTKKERRQLNKETRQPQGGWWRSLVIWGVVALAIASGLYFLFQSVGSQPSIANEQTFPGQDITDSDWVRGTRNAPVTVIEYSDFQCPACGAYEPIVKALTEAFPNDLRLVYRHLPLTQIHPNAQVAAQAAEAAGIQGKFWEMHGKLFDNQTDWSEEKNPSDKFAEYAVEIGLDVEKFKLDINSDTVKGAIEEDVRRAMQARVNATPTFLLNGQKLISPSSLEQFKQLVNKILQ